MGWSNSAWGGHGWSQSAASGGGAWTPASLGASLALWIEPAQSTMFQSNVGSGTAAAANSDPVGYIADLSGNGFHISSTADTTVRPLLQGVGVHPYLDFTAASSQLLRRDVSLGLYTSGSEFSIYAAVKANPAASCYMVSEGNSATANTIIAPLGSISGTASTEGEFYRDDTGATITQSAVAGSATGYWDNTDRVIGFTDTTTQLQAYNNGTGTGLKNYTPSTRSGKTVTTNRFGLGALYRSTGSSYWTGRVYGLVVVKGTLSSGDRASLTTYMGTLNGLSL